MLEATPPTLPDYLGPGLDLVLIGINPGLYSAMKGHYFARKNNRFWPAFSASRLSLGMREGLGLQTVGPEHDCECLRFGIGLTDVVKRPTANAAGLTPQEFARGARELIEKLERLQPRVACFHGTTGYRPVLEHGWSLRPKAVALGVQNERIGETRIFVVPNPSPANAHFRPADLTAWYDRLADFVDTVGS
ncbi:G/U mismatch-specific uracil-DNA glycosylase [Candidatus Koribacter versatilis Ellin345]|uniref:G/U mismatch-specific uracil-DNA glycosylase n=1 Tax=Koribacter versatilis (strain Ellin345) TaxID=204669 RepID=Q1II84_KORVE|nr:mismatch-specific DNA-glycosylase [Candidatus Koribacter versatilis]ABF43416.1 G/U mismatch-specific uracil-DNA glycosylase [Candidatus Koribacter versatilis Ellin345]